MSEWDKQTDIIVVGSGGGGMTAALVAKLTGLDSIVIEKTEYYGGSTSLSGGGIWVPDSHLMRNAGLKDSVENGLRYLENTVGDRSPSKNREAYVVKAKEMLAFLEKNSLIKFRIMENYPDYYPDLPGSTISGRALEPVSFKGKKLAKLFHQMRPHPWLIPGVSFTLDDWFGISMVKTDLTKLFFVMMFSLKTFINIICRTRRMTLGQALIGRLRMSLNELNVPVMLNTGVKRLLFDGETVVGIEADRNGQPLRIKAKKGVILAAGGFSHNRKMREKYGRPPINTEWTAASPGNTGDAINLGLDAGAAVDLMEDAWWGPTTVMFDGPPLFLVMERSYPGSIIVNSKGRRFVNESAPYIDVVHAMYDENDTDASAIPAYFIIDNRFRSKYFFGILGPGITPKQYFKDGRIHKSATLEDLARQVNIDPKGLKESVSRFNEYARKGDDPDFQRGKSIYDRFYGDPKMTPNPCLAPLDRPPFYAIKLYPGDLGTKGGLVTNENAQVLKTDATVIPGLYAIGNTAASVMGNSYPGPGATIGPGMTFGFIAARHAAGDTN